MKHVRFDLITMYTLWSVPCNYQFSLITSKQSNKCLPVHQTFLHCGENSCISHAVLGFRRSCFQNTQKRHIQRRQHWPGSVVSQLERRTGGLQLDTHQYIQTHTFHVRLFIWGLVGFISWTWIRLPPCIVKSDSFIPITRHLPSYLSVIISEHISRLSQPQGQKVIYIQHDIALCK